jgi:hypothetical protein
LKAAAAAAAAGVPVQCWRCSTSGAAVVLTLYNIGQEHQRSTVNGHVMSCDIHRS